MCQACDDNNAMSSVCQTLVYRHTMQRLCTVQFQRSKIQHEQGIRSIQLIVGVALLFPMLQILQLPYIYAYYNYLISIATGWFKLNIHFSSIRAKLTV